MNVRDAAWGQVKATLAALGSARRLIEDDLAHSNGTGEHIPRSNAFAAKDCLVRAEVEIIEALKLLDASAGT